MKRTRRGRRGLLLTSVLVLLALVAGACGDDDDSTAAAAAEDTNEATAASEAGDENLARAQEIVAEFSEQPTELPLTTPVGKPIPTGKTLYFITCGAPICEAEAPVIKEATDILDWELKVLSTDGSPQQIQNAWDQVVREKPDGVLYTGTPQSVVADQMKKAEANGTVVSGCCVTDPPGGGLAFVTSTPEQTGELGEVMAAWVVADAAEQGVDTNVVYLDLPDFAILTTLGEQFKEHYEDLCPGCGYDKIDIGLADLGTASDRVVSYLRSHPDVKHVVMSVDSVFALPAAFEAAGLNDIRLFGEGPGFTNAADIVSGKQAASMAFPAYEILFAMVDAVARHYAGVPIEPDFPPPTFIVTKDAIEDPSKLFPVVPDVVEQFKALWGK